jgi:hypothetical protein
VAVELCLLVLGELAVGLDAGRVLDLRLLVGHLDLVAAAIGLRQRDERQLGADHPGLDGHPLGLTGLPIEVDVLDLADLVAVSVDERAAAPALDLFQRGHALLLV